MVLHLLAEFELQESEVAQLALGAKRVVFEKLEELNKHMKPLYIKGRLDGAPMDWMLVDGGACVNILPCTTLKRLGYTEGELMKTNMTLCWFSGEASEAKGIILKELTVGSKIVSMTFFIVDVRGRYNALLGRVWIHTNGCVPSMLH
jgi:predicted aspartyl protease